MIKTLFEISELTDLSTQELVAVTHDIKPAMAALRNFEGYSLEFINKMNKVSRLCKSLDLSFAVSNCKFIVNSPRGIFKMISLKDKREGKIVYGIAKNKEDAVEAVNLYYKKMKDSKDSRAFGKLMGYPDCCLDFGDYLCNSDKGNFGFKNPGLESIKNSKEFAWQLNVFTYPMISHFPCSLTCRKSIEYVDKLFKCLDSLDIDYSDKYRRYLKEPASLYWTCADMILLYGDFKGDLSNSEMAYTKIEPMLTSEEFYQENDQNFINSLKSILEKVKEGNRIRMTEEYFEIFNGTKSIIRVEKQNPYIPVLVKPTK